MKKITPAQDEIFVRKNVDLLRQNRIEEIERELDPSISASQVVEPLARMEMMFPDGEPKSVKAISCDKSQYTRRSIASRVYRVELCWGQI